MKINYNSVELEVQLDPQDLAESAAEYGSGDAGAADVLSRYPSGMGSDASGGHSTDYSKG